MNFSCQSGFLLPEWISLIKVEDSAVAAIGRLFTYRGTSSSSIRKYAKVPFHLIVEWSRVCTVTHQSMIRP